MKRKLGGERCGHEGGDDVGLSRRRRALEVDGRRGPHLRRPTRVALHLRRGRGRVDDLPRGLPGLTVPAAKVLERAPDGSPGWVLPEKTERLVPGSSWGTFTIACTVPIALGVGWYMYRFRQGKVVEASILGAIAVLGATVAGAFLPEWGILEKYFELISASQTIFAMVAGVLRRVDPAGLASFSARARLPVELPGRLARSRSWSSAWIVANPKGIRVPPINPAFPLSGGGPYFSGPIFPYVFICIMCGAISGFHAAGNGFFRHDAEDDRLGDIAACRMIGYGAMLIEGLVGVVALIAAASLPNAMYYDINIDLRQTARVPAAVEGPRRRPRRRRARADGGGRAGRAPRPDRRAR